MVVTKKMLENMPEELKKHFQALEQALNAEKIRQTELEEKAKNKLAQVLTNAIIRTIRSDAEILESIRILYGDRIGFRIDELLFEFDEQKNVKFVKPAKVAARNSLTQAQAETDKQVLSGK